MEKISILCPTRNRVNTVNGNFICDLIESCRNTADNPECVEFIFYVDDDDFDSPSYIKSLDDDSVIAAQGPRIVLADTWNKCYDRCSGEIVMLCGDDIRFRTQRWDTIVRNKFNEFDDKIVFVFGRDGYAETFQPIDNFGTHGFVHRNWVETIGYFTAPYFSADGVDVWLNDVAKMIDRHAFVNIYTEHMHPVAGKYVWDDTHKERMTRHDKDNPKLIYSKMGSEREADAQKLLKFIDEFGRKV